MFGMGVLYSRFLSSTSDPVVCNTMEGLRRIVAKPVQKKTLFSRDAPGHCKKDNSLANIWLATVCLLAFAGFLRYDEVANIRPCVLQINPTCVTIRIPKSKTDQLRQGNDVVITRTESDTCPVAMLEEYISRGCIYFSSQLYFFRPIAGPIGQKTPRVRMTDIFTIERIAQEQSGGVGLSLSRVRCTQLEGWRSHSSCRKGYTRQAV